MDDMSISHQQQVEFVDQVTRKKCDEYTQTPDSFLNPGIEQCAVENTDDKDANQLSGIII
jgi:hypothetical protein